MITRMIEGGNLRLAEAVMGYRSKQNKANQVKMQRDNMQIDNDNARKLQADKAEQAETAADKENERQKEFETHKTTEQIRLEEEKHNNKMEEIGQTKAGDLVKEGLKQEKTNQMQTTESNNNQNQQ